MLNVCSTVSSVTESFHFCRVTRLEDRFLEDCVVDSKQIHNLAAQNVGLFAGGYGTVAKMDRQLSKMARFAAAKRWVVAVSSWNLLQETMDRMYEQDDDLPVDDSDCDVGFFAGHLRFTTVESLAIDAPADLDGVILYDPVCHIHKARTFQRYDGSNHDRPQIVADFLADRASTGESPLLCLMALKPAKSYCTERSAQAYMLDGWVFANPFSLSFVRTFDP
jgi:hypothetical protein